jgi:hypothetical protein
MKMLYGLFYENAHITRKNPDTIYTVQRKIKKFEFQKTLIKKI